MNRKFYLRGKLLTCVFLIVTFFHGCSAIRQPKLFLSCSESNDLYNVLLENNIQCNRLSTPSEAVEIAAPGSGVLILADDYPERTTPIDSSVLRIAKDKRLRLYIEYPSYLPGIEMSAPMPTILERVVVTSDSILNLEKMQILALHDCWYIPVRVKDPILSVSKVAGFDRAIYGLNGNSEAGAILFKLPETGWLVSTTKLSHFVTARYAPKKSMQAIWTFILNETAGQDVTIPHLEWNPDVRPSFERDEELPAGAARLAVRRGIDWHTRAKMLLNIQGWEEYKKLWNLNDSNMFTTVPAIDNAAPPPVSEAGDGSFGVLEGIASRVNSDGSQPTRWWLRSDSNGESSLAFALSWKMDGDTLSKRIAGNLLDWLYFRSGLFQDDSLKSNWGLLYWAPGNAQALYQDNDVKAILGCIGTSAILNSDRWNDILVKNILGNFRTTGVNGFRGQRLENPRVLKLGWKYYMNRNIIQLQPHYEAWAWSSYLWLYDKTGWNPLLEKTRNAITMMMKAYPSEWRWTNGIQQERGRMLLPLAWLIQVDDRPEYREWLKMIASDMEKCQDVTGAIREELGPLDHGDMAPPVSNETYGTGEAPLIQTNGDCVSDLLYTCNFTFLGLNEAYAATGDDQYKRMADKLADFLIRIQVKSEKHTELDGGWFRAFDFNQWEYWGSNADSGWGAWSIETGWTQAWIPTVLAMRVMNENLWDLSAKSQVNKNFEQIRHKMMP
ncbi:MAG: hypothetical protein IPN67_04395 [Bacteroidales bacterium]|nr:hypothetical protein [Bacteroidales bacterium]